MWKWKWSDVWSSMVTHTQNLCSAFNPSKCTHTVVNTHTHTHTPVAVGSHIAAAPGEQLGVRCLAQGSHLSRGIEGGESAGYSLPPPKIFAGPETRIQCAGCVSLWPGKQTYLQIYHPTTLQDWRIGPTSCVNVILKAKNKYRFILVELKLM